MFVIIIGSDIDGVINDLTLFHIACGTKHCFQNNLPYIIRKKYMESTDLLQWTSDIDKVFWNEYYLQLLLSPHYVRPFASEVTKQLVEEGHTLIFISARKNQDLPKCEKHTMFEITSEYLRINHIFYSELVLTQQKEKFISSKHVDIMIEDHPDFFKEFRNTSNIKLLCFDAPYNEHVQGNDIVRVYSWYDILTKIYTYGRKEK